MTGPARKGGRRSTSARAASLSDGHAGRATVKLKLTRKGATLLKAGKSLKIRIKATFTPTGLTPTTSTATTTVRR